MKTKERLNCSFFNYPSQIYHLWLQKSCDCWLIINFFHSRHGLNVSLWNKAQAIVIPSLSCLLFLTSKSKDLKTDLVERYQFRVCIKTSLNLKVCFFLISYKINKLIVLRSTNQIAEISTRMIKLRT